MKRLGLVLAIGSFHALGPGCHVDSVTRPRDLGAPPAAASSEAAGSEEGERRGPLSARVENPFFLIFLDLPPSGGRLLEPGRSVLAVTSSYASLWRRGEEGNVRVNLDGELSHTTVCLRHGAAETLELFASLPLLYATGGFLDGYIEAYHDALGLPEGSREDAEEDQFSMVIEGAGSTAYELEEDRIGLGDIPLGFSVPFRKEGPSEPAIALRGAIEVPTGDAERGFGNGGLDAGLGLAVEKGFGPWVLYGNLGLVDNHEPRAFRDAGLRTGTSLSALLAVERLLGASWSAVGQLQMRTSPVPGTEVNGAEDTAWILVVGAIADLSAHTRLELGLTEDLLGRTVQDFSVHAGLQWQF
ncbi:MAG: DUF3187 family protein [Planctomycetota bacterium]